MRKTSLFVTLLMVFLLLISCSMDVEEPVVEDVPPVEVPEVTKKDVADVKIKISSTTLSSRTILPDSLVKANWYEVTLKSLSDPSLIYTESVQVSEEEEAVVSFENVRIGTYSVSGEAYIKNGESTKVLVYKGEGTNNLLVEIDGANTTEIALNALSSGDSLTGSISVTLDWTEAANMEGVVKEVVGKYPLNIKFFYAEDYSANNYAPSYSQLGETLVVPVGTTTAHYEMSGIPVTGKGIGYFGVYYTVEETEYLLLTLGSDIIQIYSQQVSIPDNGDLYVITNNNIPSVINEVRLNLSYGEDPTKNLLVSWTNSDDHGSLLYDRMSLKLYDITNGRTLVEQKVLDLKDISTSNMSYQFENDMVRGHKYIVYATGRTPYGRETKTFVSNTFQAKVLVESVTIDESTIVDAYMTNGESLALTAVVNPIDATNKVLVWSNNELFDVVANDDNGNKVTLIAKKPGKTTITATSVDNPNVSDTTEKSISIRLRKPEVPVCDIVDIDGGKKIRVSWSVNDSWAESYKVYRVVDGVMESTAVAEVANLREALNSYEDENIIAGKSYSYVIKAENASLTTESFNPESEASEPSVAITPLVPTITFIQPTIDNFTLTISDGTGSASDILVTEKDSQTLYIPSAIEGIEKYTWLVNGVALKTGSYDACSSITLTSSMDAVAIRGGDANTLTLIGETADGRAYSSTLYFRVVTVKDERVDIYNTIDSIEINDGTYTLDACVYPYNATMQDLRFSSSDDSVASVDSRGVITLHSIGHVAITVSCTYGESTVMELDVYNKLDDAATLLSILNESLKPAIRGADSSFKGDWWPGLSAEEYSYDGGKVAITSSKGNSQSAGSIVISDLNVNHSYYGPITFNTTSDIKIYAKNEGASGYLGTDPLNYVGYKNEGIVKVTLPYGQKSATIQFNSISVKDNTGSYTVIFESTDPVNVDYSSISGQYPLI